MNPNIAWRHLLWKDFNQLRPALAGCLAMLACIQLLYLAMQLLNDRSSMAIFQRSYGIALIAPTLAAIAASGVLIGQERQTRSWDWSSSLPINWSSALASKFVVWLVTSIAMTVLLLILYALLYRILLLSGRAPDSQTMWQGGEERFMFAMLLIIPLEVFVLFSLAALLWNDTLLAFVIAGVVVCVGHLLLVETAVRAIYAIAWNRPYQPAEYVGTALAILGAVTALATVGLVYAFRWRWTSGLLASFSLGEYVRVRREARRNVATTVGYGGLSWSRNRSSVLTARTVRPNETKMMFAHAWRSGLGIRLAVAFSLLALLQLAPSEFRVYPGAIIAASLLLGVTVFGSEHPLGRYRFFADRGASWPRFLFTHLSVALAWWAALMVAADWLQTAQGPIQPLPVPGALRGSQLYWVAVCGFGVAAFCSLCISNPVIATALSAITLFACAVAYAIGDSYFEALAATPNHVSRALPLTFAIVLAALIVQTRRWLIGDRPRSLRFMLGTWAVGLAVPIWLSLTFGFLTIPAVEWQGVPADRIDLGAEIRLPQFKTVMPEAADTVALVPLPIRQFPEADFAALYQRVITHVWQRTVLYAWLNTWAGPIEQLSEELNDTDSFRTANSKTLWAYSEWIEQSAILGVAATQQRDSQRALAAWRLNHALLALGEQNADLAVQSLSARTSTWGMWTVLSDEDLAFLQGETDLQALLPGNVDSDLWKRALRNRWSIRKRALRDDAMPDRLPSTGRYVPGQSVKPDIVFAPALKYYPPLRWSVERVMARRLDTELRALERYRTSPFIAMPLEYQLDSTPAAHDSLAYQLRLLEQVQEQVNATIAARR